MREHRGKGRYRPLESQLELARRVGLPAVLHERDALPDMLGTAKALRSK